MNPPIRLSRSVHWTADQIGGEGIEWLAELSAGYCGPAGGPPGKVVRGRLSGVRV